MSAHRKQLRRKTKTFPGKRLIFALITFVFLFFLWQVVNLVRSTVWDGRNAINVIIDAHEIYLLSFSPAEEKMLVASVPPETYVEVTHGFASYPFRAIYELGDMDKKGGVVLTLTSQEFFGAPVDGWIKVGHEPGTEKLAIHDEQSSKDEILNLLNDSTSKTNLTVLDRLRLWWQIRQLRFDKIKFLDLGARGVFSDKSTDFDKLDNLLLPFLIERQIQEESFKIEVLNSTGQSGLGNRVGRLISNLGGEVMNLGNQDTQLDHCIIKVKKSDTGKFTTWKLEKIFSCSVEESPNLDSRGDLVLIIGNDYWQRLSRR